MATGNEGAGAAGTLALPPADPGLAVNRCPRCKREGCGCGCWGWPRAWLPAPRCLEIKESDCENRPSIQRGQQDLRRASEKRVLNTTRTAVQGERRPWQPAPSREQEWVSGRAQRKKNSEEKNKTELRK
eukprot:1156953-Pelagomonas_calceolata.AAC.3